MGGMHAAAEGGVGGAASRVPSRQYRGPRSDASSEHAASEEPARWHRATEPSHAKKSKGDPTTALSKNGHDTFTSSGTSRGGAWHGSHWSHTVARCTLTRQGTTRRGGTAYIVLAVALRPRRGPHRTRAKVLEVLLHCVASANDRREQSSGLAGPAPTSERRFQFSSSSSSPKAYLAGAQAVVEVPACG